MNSIDMLLEPLRTVLVQAGVFAPRLVFAILVILLGWLLAKMLRAAAARSLRLVNFNVLSARSGVDSFLAQFGVPYDGAELFALLLYWSVLLVAFMAASSGLGVTYLSELLRELLYLAPRIALALLIVVLGGYFARFVRGAVVRYCAEVRLPDGELLARMAQYAIMVFVVLIALDLAHLIGELARQAFLIVLAGVALALALAFGLGARDHASELLERWWPRREQGGSRV